VARRRLGGRSSWRGRRGSCLALLAGKEEGWEVESVLGERDKDLQLLEKGRKEGRSGGRKIGEERLCKKKGKKRPRRTCIVPEGWIPERIVRGFAASSDEGEGEEEAASGKGEGDEKERVD
jgi:hypothetical protein